MPKRFIDTEMALSPWFISLPPRVKALWIYMLCRCDIAGVFKLDFGLASYAIGAKVTRSDIDAMDGNAVMISADKVLIPGFIPFQYGELQHGCRPHDAVIKCLSSHGLSYPFDNSQIPLAKGYLTLKDKDKDKDKDKKEGGAGGEGGASQVALPFKSSEFSAAWSAFREHRARLRKPMTARAQELNLAKVAKLSEAEAIRWINTAVERGWQGLYEPTGGQQKVASPSKPRPSIAGETDATVLDYARILAGYWRDGESNDGETVRHLAAKVRDVCGPQGWARVNRAAAELRKGTA